MELLTRSKFNETSFNATASDHGSLLDLSEADRGFKTEICLRMVDFEILQGPAARLSPLNFVKIKTVSS